MTFAAAMLLLGVFADEPWEYPFGPFEQAADARQAARLERTYAGNGGTALAVRQTCEGNDLRLRTSDLVARNYLIAHADRTFPGLLDRIGRSAAGSRQWQCAPQLEGLVMAGVCNGYEIGGSGPALDAHPLAVARRERARRTFVRALEGGGRRGEAVMDILQDMGGQICPGLADAMRDATPNLVKRLGVPTPPLVTPAAREGEPGWAGALRALTFDGVDRPVAEAPVRAFLAHDETVALAARALARMGADATVAVPQLQRLLDAVARPPQGLWPDGVLTQIGDVMHALRAIGRPAAAALPNIAAFANRIETPGCRTFGSRAFVDLVGAIATPATAKPAIEALGPMLRCPGYNIAVAEALAVLGPAARGPVLSSLRDESRTIAERLAAAHALERPEQAPLDASDRRLVALLDAKLRTHVQYVGLNLSPKSHVAAEEIAACRAEAGLENRPAPKSTVSWDFASCISNYLCGPARETYLQTMDRCCLKDGNKTGDYCRDLRDPPPAAVQR